MDTPGEMRVFVRSVELGGFSAAARDLDLTPSALSKLVTRLEDRLGVRLMNRTTRKLALTAEGEAYFASAKRILAEIEDAETEVARFSGSPKGLLRINVGAAFGLHQLAPAVPRFLEQYPDIELEITVNDRVIDLMEENADVAIRNGHLRVARVAGKILVTEAAIAKMLEASEQCPTPEKPLDSTSDTGKDERQSGPSSTERLKSAQAAANSIAAELRKPSPNTSRKNMSPPVPFRRENCGSPR